MRAHWGHIWRHIGGAFKDVFGVHLGARIGGHLSVVGWGCIWGHIWGTLMQRCWMWAHKGESMSNGQLKQMYKKKAPTISHAMVRVWVVCGHQEPLHLKQGLWLAFSVTIQNNLVLWCTCFLKPPHNCSSNPVTFVNSLFEEWGGGNTSCHVPRQWAESPYISFRKK